MRRLLRLVIGLALVGCALCLIAIGWYVVSNRTAQREFAALRHEVAAQSPSDEPAPQDGDGTPDTALTPPAAEAQSAPKPNALAALRERNADFVFWLRVPGTPVDYPVVHNRAAPEYYLRRDFSGARSESGTPFLFGECESNPPSQNLVVYGHNMRDGSMFACLDRYRDAQYMQEHPLALIDAPDWRGEYEAFAAVPLDADEGAARALLRWTGPSADLTAESFIQEALFRSVVSSAVAPSATDAFLTLVTCEYTHQDGRLAVFFRKRDP